MSISDLLTLLVEYPMLSLCLILVLGVVFVNGWTDAPNAIATCISTKSIRPLYALIMAAICNILGVLLAFFILNAVAYTIQDMVDFTNVPYETALSALSAGMLGVSAWGVLTWYFGIPSSESHSLIGGLTGAGLACITLGYNAEIPFTYNSSWALTIYGLFGSILFGFFVAWGIAKLVQLCFKNVNRTKTKKLFKYGQIFSGGCLAFAHGAQDGLKFVGIFVLAIQLAANAHNAAGVGATITVSNEIGAELWWIALIVALIIGIGTGVGGFKIIKKIGQGLSRMEPYQGFCSDITSGIGILLASWAGLPISTSQVTTSSILGVGAAKSIRRIKWKAFIEMVITWICCFPGTILIGYLFTLLFLVI